MILILILLQMYDMNITKEKNTYYKKQETDQS